MLNPFAPSSILPEEQGVFADGAVLLRKYFLHREIEFTKPCPFRLVYDGWWFRQVLMINDHPVWREITWVRFRDRIDFRLPAAVDPQQTPGRIEIRFVRGIHIRRFTVTLGGLTIYDEIV